MNQNSKYLKKMFTIIAHEMRGPLTAIQNSASILRLYWQKLDEDDRNRHLSKIEFQIDKMDDIIKNLTLLSQTENGQLKFEPQKLVLSEFCKKIIEDMSQQGKKHWIELRINNDEEICIDDYLMNHVLTNLLSNAMKYSPNSEKVWLNVTKGSQYVVFCIADTGIGIPKEDINHIFDPFFRAANTAEIMGTGIGLVAVKEFVKIHKGNIGVKSELGKGTAFYIRIPYQKDCF